MAVPSFQYSKHWLLYLRDNGDALLLRMADITFVHKVKSPASDAFNITIHTTAKSFEFHDISADELLMKHANSMDS